MLYMLWAVVSLFGAFLPVKLAAWTCICGHTEEGKNSDLEKLVNNYREFKSCIPALSNYECMTATVRFHDMYRCASLDLCQ